MQPQLVINATMLNAPELAGPGVYTLQILRRLLPKLRNSESFSRIRLIGDREQLNRHFAEEASDLDSEVSHLGGTNPLKRIYRMNRILKRLSRTEATHYYSPTHHGVTVTGIRQTVTILDLFPLLFQNQNRQQYLYFRYYLPLVLARSAAVISLSNSTKADLARFFPNVPSPTTVYASVRDNLLRTVPTPVERVEGSPFFLTVGPNLPHKNTERTIEAYSRYAETGEANLVIAGGSGRYFAKIKRLVESEYDSISSRIIFLGYVSNDELTWLYNHALAVTIVSLSEGFGLPALEVMHFGCPVIAAKAGALPEVCGSAACFVDPYDEESIAEALCTLDKEADQRRRLRAQGLENVKRFSWDEAATRIQQILVSPQK